VTTPDKDDDFAGMLARVRQASGTAPADPHAPRVRAEPPPPKKPPESPMVSMGGLVAIGVILVLGIVGLASLSTWIARRMVAQGAAFDNPAVRRRQLQQQRLERYVVAIDTTITPAEAGRLLHAVGRAGNLRPLRRWEMDPQPFYDSTCCKGPAHDRVFQWSHTWLADVFPAARRGLTPQLRADLRKVSENPSLALFRRVAHARVADYGETMWSVPADSQASWPDLPTVRPEGLRFAAEASVAAAALDLADGRTASAESRLREIISVGFLIERSARSTVEESASSWFVNYGRGPLEALYLATGRVDEAAFASRKSDPPIRISNANRRVRVDSLESTLYRRIRDTTELVGVRWALALGAFAYLPCTSVRQALFGPSAKYRAALAEFRNAHVKFPSDERRMTMGVRGIPQMIDPWTNFRQRSTEPTAWADMAFRITRSRQLERCATLFRR
jgi:hypothetical protein